MYEDDHLEMAYEDRVSGYDPEPDLGEDCECDDDENCSKPCCSIENEIVGPDGTLSCGCYGSQREHTCEDDWDGERDYDI